MQDLMDDLVLDYHAQKEYTIEELIKILIKQVEEEEGKLNEHDAATLSTTLAPTIASYLVYDIAKRRYAGSKHNIHMIRNYQSHTLYFRDWKNRGGKEEATIHRMSYMFYKFDIGELVQQTSFREIKISQLCKSCPFNTKGNWRRSSDAAFRLDVAIATHTSGSSEIVDLLKEANSNISGGGILRAARQLLNGGSYSTLASFDGKTIKFRNNLSLYYLSYSDGTGINGIKENRINGPCDKKYIACNSKADFDKYSDIVLKFEKIDAMSFGVKFVIDANDESLFPCVPISTLGKQSHFLVGATTCKCNGGGKPKGIVINIEFI